MLGAAVLLAGAVGPSVSAQTTTFTGTVYSPLGPPTGDPIPNILVFAVNPAYPPPVFSQGIVPGPTGQNNCSLQPSLVPTTVLGSAISDAAGKFTFITSGVLPNPVTIVIQAGKWRRQYQFDNTVVTQGAINTLPALSMPSATSTTTYPLADLPHIAVVTGEADAIECIFGQLGIANSEITDPTGTGSINFFVGNEEPGGKISTSTPAEDTLVSTTAAMEKYDLIMFGCQGSPGDSAAPSYANNLTDYTSSGGRVFGTHYEYIWLEDNSTFKSVATWGGTLSTDTTTPMAASIVTSYPQGAILANWMANIGALASNPPPIVDFTSVRVNTTAVANPPAQSWANLLPFSSQSALAQKQGSYTGTPSMQFTFDTPIGAAGTPTVAINYTNNTTFLQGDVADTITINVVNSSATATSPGLTLTISLPAGLTPTGLMGVGNTGWVCNLAILICTEPGALAAGATDSVQLTFNIAPTAQVGQVSLTGTLTGGGLSGSGSQQCGRVLYNDYHVEPPNPLVNNVNALYNNGAYCSNTASGAKKFLEYSLYDLSNFVAPSTSDLIEIKGITTLTWLQPATIPYGTALSVTQLDATASDVNSGVTIPGAFVYAPPAGTVPNAPSVTVSVNFTPTDSTDYNTASDTVNIAVTPDATTTTLTTPVTPIYYGQVIALTAVESVVSNGPATTLNGGMLNFLINGVVTCSFTEPTPGGTSSCPPSTGAGYNAQPTPYLTQSVYTGDTDFSASQSAVYPVTVLPAPTATTVALSATSVMVGTAVTFTSAVTNTVDSATPVGMVTFLDGTVTIGTAAVAAQGTASLTLSNLAAGLHSIMACYAAPTNSSGAVNFVASCSAFKSLLVTLPPNTDSTQTLLTSNVNPSYFGQAITFTSTVSTTGAFVAIPTGTVTFLDGGTAIGTGTIDSAGNASYTTSALAVGTHTMTASYAGQGAFTASVSPAYTQGVNSTLTSAGTGFILQVTPTNLTVPVGGSVSANVTVIELNNFQQPVQLSCAGLPSEATCTFAQSLIPETGGTTQLTIGATAPHNCGSSAPYFVAGGRGTALLWLGVTSLGLFLARKRRRLLQSLAVAAALLLLPALQGCGTGNCTDFGLKPGTYTFTVQGTSTGSGVPCPYCVITQTGQITRTQAMTMNVTIQ